MAFLYILLGIVALLALLLLYYADRNMHRDARMMKKVWKAGYVEKQVTLPNGTVLNYGEGGDVGKTSLLLIHGQGQAWQDYDPVLPVLSEQYHVFAVDCHGHGKSSHDAARYSCKAMTEDFLWFAKHIIGEPCVVSGHSSGGILAANMAATEPSAVSALVIEDAPFFCVEPDEMKARNAIVWQDSFQLMHDFSSQNADVSFPEYYMRNSLLMSLFGNLKDKAARSVRAFYEKHPDGQLRIWYIPQSMLRGQFYGKRYDMRFAETFYDGSWFDGVGQEQLLRNIQCPCTYIKAKTGYLVGGKMTMEPGAQNMEGAVLCCANTDQDAEKVCALIPDCRRIITESNDHLIHAKYPQLFIAALTAYCAGRRMFFHPSHLTE